jgi:hypothetical protein
MYENTEMNGQKMTGSVQTMLTWVRVLESKEEIPQHYQHNIESFHLLEPFPYTLLVPPLKNQRNKPAERLLVLIQNVLHVFEKRGKKIISDQIALHPALDMEMGNALLYSWITLRETNANNQSHIITIPFNTATARHLNPIIDLIKPVSPTTATQQNHTPPHQNLVHADFKYNAFARDCISKDSSVINSLWQPTLKKALFQLFSKTFYRNIATAHYSILTQQELILLWDDEYSVENRGVRYGGIRRFIPRELICDISAVKNNGDYCRLLIQLSSNENIEWIFVMDALDKINRFIEDFHSTAIIN